jgi:hypothetical protein
MKTTRPDIRMMVPPAAASRAGRDRVRFPADLRDWVGAERLLAWVLEEVSHLEVAARGSGFHHGGEVFNFNQTLATLAYAYLCGLESSEQVEEALDTDPGLRYLGRGVPLSAAAIRRFRRLHRGALSLVLAQVLRRALAERWSLAAGSDKPDPAADGSATPDLAGLGAAEAEARLSRAVFADTMALDV